MPTGSKSSTHYVLCLGYAEQDARYKPHSLREIRIPKANSLVGF